MTVEARPMGVACNIQCTYCLVEGTPVLMANGIWKPIEMVRIGDEIVGFDEFSEKKNKQRIYKKAIVTATPSRTVDGVKIITDKGEVSCSLDHIWIDKIGRWREARNFKVGQTIKFVSSPVVAPTEDYDFMLGYFVGVSEGDGMYGSWGRGKSKYIQYRYRLALKDSDILDRTEEYARYLSLPLYRTTVNVGIICEALLTSIKDEVNKIISWIDDESEKSESFMKGYISGIFDAEGSYSQVIRIAGKKNSRQLKRSSEYLSHFGFTVTEDVVNEISGTCVRVLGGQKENIRFFSTFNPACTRKFTIFDNAMKGGYATIQEIIPIKEQQMYDLTTTTSTFVAGGFASHNCYQEPIRDAQNINTLYDIDKMIAELDKVGQEFNLFGGEALLVPLEDLERFWKYGFEKHGRNGLQTNGTLITDEHIKLFKKYNVSVGVSVDGANELNDLRKVGNIEKTREHTQKTMDNILKMVKNGIGVGVIITVHNYNATEDKLPRLKNFIRWLGDIGVKGGNLHLLEVDNEMVAKQLCLPPERELEVFLDLAKFFEEESNKDLRWQPFCDMPDMLKGEEDGTTCYWHRCDPLNTQSVYGIEGDGQLSNCGRTNKEGIDWYKADDFGYERYISLYYSPDEIGGCKGCRFWSICGGSCVGESQLGDMRNKTTHCSTMKGLLTYYEDKLEEEGIIPLSKHHLLEEAEKVILDNLVVGNNLVLSKAIKIAEEKYSDLKDQVGVSVYKEGVKVL